MKTLRRDTIVRLHDDSIRRTGGCPGVLDEERLEAVVQRPLSGTADVEFFPSIFDKAAALGHAIATSHPFVDGNKRTALLASSVLLDANGFLLEVSHDQAEETMVALATGSLTLQQFAEWLKVNSRPVEA